MEPGLEQSESFYSLTYVALFVGHVIAAVTTGLLFNLIPTWYLFLVSTLSHTLGYLLYALVTNGWMMILARVLAGLQLGAVDSLAFSYFGVSFEKYKQNLKILGKFEEKKVAKVKGYVFSSNSIGTTLGFWIGAGMNYLAIYHLSKSNFSCVCVQDSQQSWLSFQRLHSSDQLAGSVWLLEWQSYCSS